MINTDVRQVLLAELVRRTKMNPSYSLRSFARNLELSPATLSGVLSSRRRLSISTAEKVADKLSLSPLQRKSFLQAAVGAFAKSSRAEESDPFEALSEATFHVVSEWYYFAILELTFLSDKRSQPSWFAKKLGISIAESREAIERLLAMGLLKKNSQGQFVKTSKHISFVPGVTSAAVRKRHDQILTKAKESLHNDPIDTRDFTAMTMAIDPDLLPEAVKRITQFRRELCEFLESKQKKAVYELSIQLFPLTKK